MKLLSVFSDNLRKRSSQKAEQKPEKTNSKVGTDLMLHLRVRREYMYMYILVYNFIAVSKASPWLRDYALRSASEKSSLCFQSLIKVLQLAVSMRCGSRLFVFMASRLLMHFLPADFITHMEAWNKQRFQRPQQHLATWHERPSLSCDFCSFDFLKVMKFLKLKHISLSGV